MTEPSRVDVLAELRAHREYMERELESLRVTDHEMKNLLYLMADHVIGPVMHHATGEAIVDGNGLPLRDRSKGLITIHAKLDLRQIFIVTASNLAVVAGTVVAVVRTLA